jgi:hypothetical protein
MKNDPVWLLPFDYGTLLAEMKLTVMSKSMLECSAVNEVILLLMVVFHSAFVWPVNDAKSTSVFASNHCSAM